MWAIHDLETSVVVDAAAGGPEYDSPPPCAKEAGESVGSAPVVASRRVGRDRCRRDGRSICDNG